MQKQKQSYLHRNKYGHHFMTRNWSGNPKPAANVGEKQISFMW